MLEPDWGAGAQLSSAGVFWGVSDGIKQSGESRTSEEAGSLFGVML